MGSSRARDGVIPQRVEQALGLSSGSVLNLGVTGGTPFDALTLYRRNRDKLKRAHVLVFATEDWHCNKRFPPSTLDRRFATFSERFGVFDGPSTVSLAAGAIWRTYDAQEPLKAFAYSLLRGRKGLRMSPDGRIAWRDKEREEGPKEVRPDQWIDRFYGSFELGRGRLEHLNQLIELAHEDGVEVLVVRLPWRDQYINALRARHGAEFDRTTDLVRQTKGAKVVLFERASALGIEDPWFYDYGHLALRGARIMSDILAREITKAYPKAIAQLGAPPASADDAQVRTP
jgi:hypothetical protein